MTSAPQPHLLTAEELMELPDDGNAYELDEGRLVIMPPAKYRSSRVSARVLIRVGSFVERHDLGACTGEQGGVVLQRGPDIVRAPDVTFVRKNRLLSDIPGYFEGAPDLVVEFLSPSDRMARVLRKVKQYLAAGVRLIWVIDPEDRTAFIYRPGRDVIILDEDGVLDGEDVLPGFSLALSEIWV
ncbi:MAG: Uma2 family endonuclease [Chloroflexi bacterium]|nr:Uma2 family endonuclease [Chloroflexota bacterium]